MRKWVSKEIQQWFLSRCPMVAPQHIAETVAGMITSSHFLSGALSHVSVGTSICLCTMAGKQVKNLGGPIMTWWKACLSRSSLNTHETQPHKFNRRTWGTAWCETWNAALHNETRKMAAPEKEKNEKRNIIQWHATETTACEANGRSGKRRWKRVSSR